MTKLRDAAQDLFDKIDERGASPLDWPEYDALRDALNEPEPYDQAALELCPICCWKTVMPGEPCLMCERNERMCEPTPKAKDTWTDDGGWTFEIDAPDHKDVHTEHCHRGEEDEHG